MELNHDHVRDLLLFVESLNTEGASENELLDFARQHSISKEELIYTIKRLKEAAYINASISYANNSVYWFSISSITWSGHEYLDNIRDPKIWKHIKKSASAVSSISLSVLGSFAKDTALKVLTGEIKLI